MPFNRRKKQSINNNGSPTKIPKRIWTCVVLSPLVILLALWIYTALHFLILVEPTTSNDIGNGNDGSSNNHDGHQPGVTPKNIKETHHVRGNTMQRQINNEAQEKKLRKQQIVIEDPYASSKLLSRNQKVIITSSARGNLGPPSVLNQHPPGTDWIKDRWQAASDMGGTAIPGSHWVMLDFRGLLLNNDDGINASNNVSGGDGGGAVVYVTKIVLDWETAYANDYRIEGIIDPPTTTTTTTSKNEKHQSNDDDWCVLYDGAQETNINNANNDKKHYPHRSVEEYGQSPGVKQKLPLHIIHTIDSTPTERENDGEYNPISKGSRTENKNCRTLRYLRIFVRKPARGWGVSLWQVDVHGAIVSGNRQK